MFFYSSIKKISTMLFLASVLASCAVGPDYLRPPVGVPVAFRGANPATSNARSMGDLAWAQIFKDPALMQLINTGLANNFDLRIAAARVDEYRARAGIVRGAMFPQIDAGIGYSAENGSLLSDPKTNRSNDTARNWNANLQLSWELDLFGRLRRNDESAMALWLASEEGRRSVVITLVGDIASAYFTLRQYDLELEISQRTVVSNKQQVEFYRDRLNGGASNRLELDQAVANLATTSSRVPDFERRIAVQENYINLLLGRGPGPIPRGQSLVDQSYPPILPVGLPVQLLERRPDIKQVEQELVAANADIGAAKALFFPNISITGSAGRLSNDFSNLGNSDAAIWSLGSGVLQPLFHGGAIRFNYEAKQAQFEQALAQYQKTVQNSFRETSDAIVTIEKSKIASEQLQVGVVALRDATELARARYGGGLSSYLDILTADQSLFSAELQFAEMRGTEFTAMVNLYRALGGGLEMPQQAIKKP